MLTVMITMIIANIAQNIETVKDLRTEIAFLVAIVFFLWCVYDLLKHYWSKIRLRELEVKEKEIQATIETVKIEQEKKDKRAELLNRSQTAMVEKLENVVQVQKESNFALEDVAERMSDVAREQVEIKEKIGEIGKTCKINTDKLLILGDRHETHRVLLGTEGA